MRFLPTLLAFALLVLPVGARAQHNPVVLELFTSQGCSSCPPADALLSELSEREGVIALALHVDYWDYLGWKDSFGKAAHTLRQRAYAKKMHKRSVYTPQVIVQGEDQLVGHDAEAIDRRIAAHRAKPPMVALRLDRGTDGTLGIDLKPLAPGIGPSEVHVVRFTAERGVSIEAGENAGNHFEYTDIVTDWRTVAEWDGRSEARFELEGVEDGPVAVIVQRHRMGPILSAAELR
jgi:hypothetical protein